MDSHAEWVFSLLVSASWCDLLKHQRWTHKLDGCSVILISGCDSNIEEGLTSWMDVQPMTAILVSGSNLLKQRKTHTLPVDECSAFLISGSDLHKHWRGTHALNGCSLLVSGCDLLKHWEGLTNWMHVQPFWSMDLIYSKLEMDLHPRCSVVSGPDLLKHWRGTHTLDVQLFWSVDLNCSNTEDGLTSWTGVQPFLSVNLVCSNTEEELTHWMGVQPFWSVDVICLNTERDSHPEWCSVFSRSGQWMWSVQTLKSTHILCSAILVSESDLLKHWRRTHILDECSAVLVSASDLLKHWSGGTHRLDTCISSLDGCSVLG